LQNIADKTIPKVNIALLFNCLELNFYDE
jgi:hypothetical protein